jgi:hypothetical protein
MEDGMGRNVYILKAVVELESALYFVEEYYATSDRGSSKSYVPCDRADRRKPSAPTLNQQLFWAF